MLNNSASCDFSVLNVVRWKSVLWCQIIMHETVVYIPLKFHHHSSVAWVLSIHLQYIKTELGRDVAGGFLKMLFQYCDKCNQHSIKF